VIEDLKSTGVNIMPVKKGTIESGVIRVQDFDLIVEGDFLYAMYLKKPPYPKDIAGAKPANRYGLAKSQDGLIAQNKLLVK